MRSSLLGMILLAAAACSSPSASAPNGAAALPPTKRALLIGIDDYKHAGSGGVTNLKGCVNDVENMRALLVGKFDFTGDADHLRLLKNERATRQAIVAEIEQLIARTSSGDVVVIYFAGHGSQMKDTSNTRINGLDETIVPHDSRDPEGKVFDISGNELEGLVDRLSAKTPHVTLVLDSCQSGTMLKDTAIRSRSVRAGYPRFIPPDTRQPPATAASGSAGSATRGPGIRPETARWAMIAGARADELSNEYEEQGRREGAMTHTLVATLKAARPGATYRDVMDVVMGRVSEMFPSQHPQLEGPGDDSAVFGVTSILPAAFVLAQPVQSGATLQAGEILGVTRDSIFEVYPPGEKTFASGAGVAKVRVTDVQPDTSTAVLQSGGAIARDSRAIERERKFVSPQVRVLIADDAPVLAGIRNEISRYQQIEVVRDRARADLSLTQANGSLELRGLGAVEPLFTVSASLPDVTQAVTTTILSWAQWFNLRNISNSASPLRVRLDVSVDGAPLSGSGQVKSDQKVAFTIANESFSDLYVVLFDFSTDGSRTPLFPRSNGQQKLEMGRSFSLPPTGVSVPTGRTNVTDTIKVFATTTPVDFRTMVAAAIPKTRGIGSLQELFWAAAQGQSRNVDAPVSLAEWVTAERMFTVVK
jgi:hypothetical protein